MTETGKTRVFVGASFDGFIAGEDDDLSWLPGDAQGDTPDDHGWDDFIAAVGAVLLGRRTYDIVLGMDAWPYKELPVLVATTRALEPVRATVRGVSGSIEAMVHEARREAAGRDVYLDGGILIREAMDAGLVDELTVTIIPVVLGRGVPLLAGATRRRTLALTRCVELGNGIVQLRYQVARP